MLPDRTTTTGDSLPVTTTNPFHRINAEVRIIPAKSQNNQSMCRMFRQEGNSTAPIARGGGGGDQSTAGLAEYTSASPRVMIWATTGRICIAWIDSNTLRSESIRKFFSGAASASQLQAGKMTKCIFDSPSSLYLRSSREDSLNIFRLDTYSTVRYARTCARVVFFFYTNSTTAVVI